MFCSTCGCPLKTEDRFCPRCGFRVAPLRPAAAPFAEKPAETPENSEEIAAVAAAVAANEETVHEDSEVKDEASVNEDGSALNNEKTNLGENAASGNESKTPEEQSSGKKKRAFPAMAALIICGAIIFALSIATGIFAGLYFSEKNINNQLTNASSAAYDDGASAGRE